MENEDAADESLQTKYLLFALAVLIGLTALLLWRSPGRPLRSLPFSAAYRETLKPAAPTPRPSTTLRSTPRQLPPEPLQYHRHNLNRVNLRNAFHP
jgi:hypothetical protein